MNRTQVGDGTNLVVTLAGELLAQAEELLQMGLHPSEIIAGYEKACTKALAELESTFTVYQTRDELHLLRVSRKDIGALLSNCTHGYTQARSLRRANGKS